MRRFQCYHTPSSQSLQDYFLCLDGTTWRLASFAVMRDNHSFFLYLSGCHQFTIDSVAKGLLFNCGIFLSCLEKRYWVILKLNSLLIYVVFHYREARWTENSLAIVSLGHCIGHNTVLWFDTITKTWYYTKTIYITGRMAQLTQCKHEDYSSVLRTHFIKKV